MGQNPVIRYKNSFYHYLRNIVKIDLLIDRPDTIH